MTAIETPTAQRQCRVIMNLLSTETQKFCSIKGSWWPRRMIIQTNLSGWLRSNVRVHAECPIMMLIVDVFLIAFEPFSLYFNLFASYPPSFLHWEEVVPQRIEYVHEHFLGGCCWGGTSVSSRLYAFLNIIVYFHSLLTLFLSSSFLAAYSSSLTVMPFLSLLRPLLVAL